jgi:hypothetical protein
MASPLASTCPTLSWLNDTVLQPIVLNVAHEVYHSYRNCKTSSETWKKKNTTIMETLTAKWGFTVHRQSLKKNVAFIEHELGYNKLNNTLSPTASFSDGHYRKLLHDVYPTIAKSSSSFLPTSSITPTPLANSDKLMSFLSGLTKTIDAIDRRMTMMDKRFRASTKPVSDEQDKKSMRDTITELATLSVKQRQTRDLSDDVHNAGDESDEEINDTNDANTNSDNGDDDDDNDDDDGDDYNDDDDNNDVDDDDDDDTSVASNDDSGVNNENTPTPPVSQCGGKRPRSEFTSRKTLLSKPSPITSSILVEHNTKLTERAAESQRKKLKADKAVNVTTAMLTAGLKKNKAAVNKVKKSLANDQSSVTETAGRRRHSTATRSRK